MENYLAQKADQALEELCKEASSERRFQRVLMHLEPLAKAHFLDTAPAAVAEAMKRLVAAKSSPDDDEKAFAVRRAITTILEAWGHQEGLRMDANKREEEGA